MDFSDIPIPADYAARMPRHEEASDLVSIGDDHYGRPARLAPAAAAAWQKMKEAARADGIGLLVLSAFRSVEYQAGIIRKKQAQGVPFEEIVRVWALPGFSEHHTGRAIDIGSVASEGLDGAFEHTAEFAWLKENAGRFGFTLSYPRDNPHGIIYEPWHWAFTRL